MALCKARLRHVSWESCAAAVALIQTLSACPHRVQLQRQGDAQGQGGERRQLQLQGQGVVQAQGQGQGKEQEQGHRQGQGPEQGAALGQGQPAQSPPSAAGPCAPLAPLDAPGPGPPQCPAQPQPAVAGHGAVLPALCAVLTAALKRDPRETANALIKRGMRYAAYGGCSDPVKVFNIKKLLQTVDGSGMPPLEQASEWEYEWELAECVSALVAALCASPCRKLVEEVARALRRFCGSGHWASVLSSAVDGLARAGHVADAVAFVRTLGKKQEGAAAGEDDTQVPGMTLFRLKRPCVVAAAVRPGGHRSSSPGCTPQCTRVSGHQRMPIVCTHTPGAL